MCVFKYHAFIYFLRPPPWYGTVGPTSKKRYFTSQKSLSTWALNEVNSKISIVKQGTVCWKHSFPNWPHLPDHVVQSGHRQPQRPRLLNIPAMPGHMSSMSTNFLSEFITFAKKKTHTKNRLLAHPRETWLLLSQMYIYWRRTIKLIYQSFNQHFTTTNQSAPIICTAVSGTRS